MAFGNTAQIGSQRRLTERALDAVCSAWPADREHEKTKARAPQRGQGKERGEEGEQNKHWLGCRRRCSLSQQQVLVVGSKCCNSSRLRRRCATSAGGCLLFTGLLRVMPRLAVSVTWLHEQDLQLGRQGTIAPVKADQQQVEEDTGQMIELICAGAQ